MVGIFAGRGDVIIAMGLATLFGIWIGYYARKGVEWLRSKRKTA